MAQSNASTDSWRYQFGWVSVPLKKIRWSLLDDAFHWISQKTKKIVLPFGLLSLVRKIKVLIEIDKYRSKNLGGMKQVTGFLFRELGVCSNVVH